MKKPLLYSRILQFSIVLSFLLPFFFVGCEQKSEEAAPLAADTVVATHDTLTINSSDTSSPQKSIPDSSVLNTLSKTDTISTQPGTNLAKENDNSFSEELAEEYPWLKLVLIPRNHVFTGIALVINLSREAIFFNLFIAFLLILICLSIKFLDKHAIRTQLLLNALVIVSLFLYVPDFLSGERLWGFWVCFTLVLTTLALDIYRLVQYVKSSNAVK